MAKDFNSTFGGKGQEPSPHSIQIVKKPGDFNSTFGGIGQDISRHAIPPVSRIGSDYVTPTPAYGVNHKPIFTANLSTPDNATVTTYPFTCKVTSNSLTITPGTVNSQLPSNIGSTFTISTSGNSYVNLQVYASDAQVISSSVLIDPNPPQAIPVSFGQPPTTFYINIAVLVNGVPFRTIGGGSLTATSYEVYRLAKAMTSPDSIPYDSYYSWRLGLV